jgi:hypothetical protein
MTVRPDMRYEKVYDIEIDLLCPRCGHNKARISEICNMYTVECSCCALGKVHEENRKQAIAEYRKEMLDYGAKIITHDRRT